MRPDVLSLTLITLLLVVSQTVAARSFYGDRIKIRGAWDEPAIIASRIQDRDPSKDPRKGQIEGRIAEIDLVRNDLRLGPFTVAYNQETQFDGLRASELKPGAAVELRVELVAPGRLHATRIEPADEPMADEIEIIGAVTGEERRPSGDVTLEVLGTTVLVRPYLYNAAALTSRHDDKRPPDQFTTRLFGKPLVIGGEFETRVRHRSNFGLERDDGKTRVDVGAKLELFYPVSPRFAAFAAFGGIHEQEVYVMEGDRKLERGVERREAWVFVQDFLLEGMGLQVGRQNFADHREWWWDSNLDAVRLRYSRRPFYAELAVAKELMRVSTLEPLDPDERDIVRLLSRASWDFHPDHRIEAFALRHDDRSGTESIDSLIAEVEEDDEDSRLLWYGARLSGDFEFASGLNVRYWFGGARQTGRRTRLDWQDFDSDRLRLVGTTTTDVNAWAWDAGVNWLLPTRAPYSITVSVARGSGDDDPTDGVDTSFTQTGLHDNNAKFRGIDRFRYYGEALRPELSNLEIFTVAVGRRFWSGSSIELVYHAYSQLAPRDRLGGTVLKADPSGDYLSIGKEFDLVIGIEEWKHLEIEIIAAIFLPGRAFESPFGDSLVLETKLNYNF